VVLSNMEYVRASEGGAGGLDMMFFDPSGNRFWAIENPK
jgi:hypothetical protein